MGTPLRTAQDVADYLQIPITTLYQWRTKGTGPRAVKVGRHIRFRQEDVDAWCEQHSDEPGRGLDGHPRLPRRPVRRSSGSRQGVA